MNYLYEEKQRIIWEFEYIDVYKLCNRKCSLDSRNLITYLYNKMEGRSSYARRIQYDIWAHRLIPYHSVGLKKAIFRIMNKVLRDKHGLYKVYVWKCRSKVQEKFLIEVYKAITRISVFILLWRLYMLYESFRRKPGWRFTAGFEFVIFLPVKTAGIVFCY